MEFLLLLLLPAWISIQSLRVELCGGLAIAAAALNCAVSNAIFLGRPFLTTDCIRMPVFWMSFGLFSARRSYQWARLILPKDWQTTSLSADPLNAMQSYQKAFFLPVFFDCFKFFLFFLFLLFAALPPFAGGAEQIHHRHQAFSRNVLSRWLIFILIRSFFFFISQILKQNEFTLASFSTYSVFEFYEALEFYAH